MNWNTNKQRFAGLRTGLAALFISFSMLGCELIGTKIIEDAERPVGWVAPTDYEGYYNRSFSKVTLCAVTNHSNCKTLTPEGFPEGKIDTSLLPAFMAHTLSDPLLYIQFKRLNSNAGSDLFAILDPNNSLNYYLTLNLGISMLPVYSKKNSPNFEYAYEVEDSLWIDPSADCKVTMDLLGSGTLVSDTPKAPLGTLMGQAKMGMTYTLDFSGSGCEESFKQMIDCYKNVSSCNASNPNYGLDNVTLQNYAKEILNPYLNLNVIDFDSLPKVETLSTEVFTE